MMEKQTKVINIYHKVPYQVYIGRAGKGQDGTFGNPFSKGSREEKIAQFKIYFYNRIKNDKEFAKQIMSLRGKTLGCFCSPKLCHGDVIIEYLNNLPDTKPIKLAVVGSRSFYDYGYMKDILDWHDIKKIISGGARGVDKLAEQYAVDKNIPLKIFPADWDTFGKSAGYKRNVQIVEAADEIAAFWDGKSKGTAHSIQMAEDQGKPVHIYWPPTIEYDRDAISDLGL